MGERRCGETASRAGERCRFHIQLPAFSAFQLPAFSAFQMLALSAVTAMSALIAALIVNSRKSTLGRLM
jgi:hypothetical protein